MITSSGPVTIFLSHHPLWGLIIPPFPFCRSFFLSVGESCCSSRLVTPAAHIILPASLFTSAWTNKSLDRLPNMSRPSCTLISEILRAGSDRCPGDVRVHWQVLHFQCHSRWGGGPTSNQTMKTQSSPSPPSVSQWWLWRGGSGRH